MSHPTADDVLEFARARKRFTTRDVCRHFRINIRAAAALLANMKRFDRHDIEADTPEKDETGSSRWRLIEDEPVSRQKTRIVHDVSAPREPVAAPQKRQDIDAAVAGLEALSRLNGSGAKAVATFLVREACKNPTKVIRFDSVGLTIEPAKVRDEVRRIIASDDRLFGTLMPDHFTMAVQSPTDWRPTA